MMCSYQRIFLIVIDSLGISGAPDAACLGPGRSSARAPAATCSHNLPGRRPDSPGRWLQPLSPAAPAYDSAAFSFRTSAASWSFSFWVRHDSVSSANRRC